MTLTSLPSFSNDLKLFIENFSLHFCRLPLSRKLRWLEPSIEGEEYFLQIHGARVLSHEPKKVERLKTIFSKIFPIGVKYFHKLFNKENLCYMRNEEK